MFLTTETQILKETYTWMDCYQYIVFVLIGIFIYEAVLEILIWRRVQYLKKCIQACATNDDKKGKDIEIQREQSKKDTEEKEFVKRSMRLARKH